jgi:hypothetical protein
VARSAAVYDLEDEERHYTAKIVRWRSCDKGGGYLANLVAVPKDRSLVVAALVQFPKHEGTAYDTKTNRLLQSIEVKSNLLP